MGRNIFGANLCDVALDFTPWKIDCIQSSQVCFEFAGEDTLMPESLQGKMESTYASEQVNIA